MRYSTPLERFLAKVQKTGHDYSWNGTPCWLWTGYLLWNGYGRFRIGDTEWKAHRWFWEQKHGLLLPGFCLDHLCRNRHCVNLQHLEAVTFRENLLRGETLTRAHAQKTHCLHGHLYTPENTIKKPGGRECRECNRIRTNKAYYLKYQEKRKQARVAKRMLLLEASREE
jgi:HNH endonuclease